MVCLLVINGVAVVTGGVTVVIGGVLTSDRWCGSNDREGDSSGRW